MTSSARAPAEAQRALWPGPWPAEDGGPQRRQTASPGLGLAAGERLAVGAVRAAAGTTMVVLRDPGEVYVLRHSLGRRPLTDPMTSWVERVDPQTLAVVERSPDLLAGPFWPGGLAAHANGSLHVVTGNHCHRLSPRLEVLATRRLPAPRPYNSFVVLADGTLAMKDIDRGLGAAAQLVLLDPDTLAPVVAPVSIGEPSIARLSADGNDLYVVGAEAVHRFRWDGTRLERDADWGGSYARPGNSYGWDPVLAGGQLWFMDNGAHEFASTMRGAGVAPGAMQLWRFSLDDPADREAVEVSGMPYGAVTNPPLYDAQRHIAVAYDSANGIVQAFRFDGRLTPLWRRELSHAAHMILFADTGELVLNDHHGPRFARTRAGRAVSRRMTFVAHHAPLRGVAERASRDDVVLVDVETGIERGRASVPTLMQSVVFGAPGFARDLYWCSMTTLARIVVA